MGIFRRWGNSDSHVHPHRGKIMWGVKTVSCKKRRGLGSQGKQTCLHLHLGLRASKTEKINACKEIKPVTPKGDPPWILIGRTDAEAEVSILRPTWCKEPTHWKRPWCWKRLRTGGEGDDRGWDGWIPSLTQWTWVWANSRGERRAGKPGVLPSVGSQRVGHNWATEQQQFKLQFVVLRYGTVLAN